MEVGDGNHFFCYPCGCQHRDCERCQPVVDARRASAAWERLGDLARVPLLVGVGTVPEHLRGRFGLCKAKKPKDTPKGPKEQVDAHGLRALETAWHKVFGAWLLDAAGLHEPGWRAGGVLYSHPTGDDLDTWQPHVNALCPGLAWNDKTGQVHRLRFHVEPEDLDELRRRWKAALEDLAGEAIAGEVDVFYEFRIGVRRKRHAIRYFARVFPGWGERCNLRPRWFGFMGNRLWKFKAQPVLEEWLKEHPGRWDDAPPEGQAEAWSGLVCPHCGGVRVHMTGWTAYPKGPVVDQEPAPADRG